MSSAKSSLLSNWPWGGPADLPLECASDMASREGIQAPRVAFMFLETKPINNRQKHFLPPLFRGPGPDFQKPGSDLVSRCQGRLPRLPGQPQAFHHQALLLSPAPSV